MDRQGAQRLRLLASVLLTGLLAWSGCGTSPGDDPALEATQAETVETAFEASRLARTTFPGAMLEAYLETGEQLGLDWAVLAATDSIERGGSSSGSPASDGERISAIGYTLLASGAPGDYETALAARGGSEGFASEVLDLAERFRGDPEGGRVELEPSEGLLSVPVDGQVVAGYGRGFGVLHDGADIEAEAGAPIRAPGPGVTLTTGFHPAYGNQTCVLHELQPEIEGVDRVTTCYGNQSAYETEPGETLERGELIGRVGCSGPCLRPHVHLKLHLGTGQDAETTDPDPFFDADLGLGAELALDGAR